MPDAPRGSLGYEEILGEVRRLSPLIAKRSEEIEQLRRLPEDLVESLRAAGVFRAAMPAEWGGSDLTSMEQIAIIEEASRADTSLGWCVMIGMDSGIYAGFLRPDVARRMYPSLDMVTAGQVRPGARAHVVEGGYRLEGTWRFGSGCTHADVIAGGSLVFRDGEQVKDERGRPVWRVVLLPRDQVEIIDNWYTTGLAGSGSCDYRAEGVFVPEEHTFTFDQPLDDRPINRHPDAILRKMPGVPLGAARAALDYVHEIAEKRVDRASGTGWRDSPRARRTVAQCELNLAAARTLVYSSVEDVWARLVANEPVRPQERAIAALARYNAFRTARDIASDLYDLVGGDSIYSQRTPLDRRLRDLTTICQHVVGQDLILDWSGELLLGGMPDTPFI
ncbi:acyl-CoA dehydrogenase family protein [Kitasatospora sp. NPDC101183]|uniref:acyl-CoA dehydrogenase family protein n=1 Tax=Kitasatospora sp. NPDC101183 TaxID=3364100 RepID=UPI0037F50D34